MLTIRPSTLWFTPTGQLFTGRDDDVEVRQHDQHAGQQLREQVLGRPGPQVHVLHLRGAVDELAHLKASRKAGTGGGAHSGTGEGGPLKHR